MPNQTQSSSTEHVLYLHDLKKTNWSKLDFFEQCFHLKNDNKCHTALFLLEINASVIVSNFYLYNYRDEILREIELRLNHSINKDIFYHFNDNLFLIMLNFPSADQDQAITQITKLTDNLKQHLSKEIILYGNQYKPIFNMGWCIIESQNTDFYAVLKQANCALDYSKKQGKNETCIFNFNILEKMEFSFTELAQAIAKNELQVFYQAQFNSCGTFEKAEALIRWHHPVNDLISTDNFILFAEQSDLIVPIGYLIIQEVCQQLSQWHLCESTKHIKLSINISYKQIMQSEFVEQIFSIIKDTGVNPKNLTFEISQSLFAHDISSVLDKINELRLIGIKFSLDNFGIGNSALAYLRILPFDQIKIDRSFIADMTSNSNVASLVHIIIDEAKVHHCEVIAMGVESKEQQNLLDMYGCHAYQGFIFSHPLPMKDFENFIKRSSSQQFFE